MLRTTEVHVDSPSIRAEDEIQCDPHDLYGEGQKGFAVTSRTRVRATAPASSEEELAARGAAPT